MDQTKPAYQPLLRVAIVAALGIVADRCCPLPITVWMTVFAASVSFFALFFWRGANRSGALVLLIAVAALSGAWHHVHWNLIGQRDISSFALLDSRPVVLRGRIDSQPRWLAPDPIQDTFSEPREERSRMVVKIESIKDGAEFVAASGRVQCFAEGRVHLLTGDRIEMAGNLARIDVPGNPGEFDLQKFFRGKGTYCWMNAGPAESIKQIAGGNRILALASKTRFAIDAKLWQFLDKRQAPLASAMLLGNRDQLDRVNRDEFLLSGTVHLLAISGLHVGILASLILLLSKFRILSRRQGLLATAVFVCLYAWLVEFRPPVTRATILVCVFCYCRWIGRTPFSFNSLALAALIVLFVNPVQLFGSGAQLSFLAVGSLIYARPWLVPERSNDPVDRLIASSLRTHERFIRYCGSKTFQAFLVSTVIWFFAVPAVAAQFHVVAPVALFANPFLLIPVTFGLAFGLGVVTFGFILPPLGKVMAAGCDLSLECIQVVVQYCSTIPAGHWWTSGPPVWAVVLFYTAIVIAFLCFPAAKGKRLAATFAIWCLVCWAMPNWIVAQKQHDRQALICTVIDVGHGGCILLELPNGKNVLYDCGSFGSPRNAQQNAASVLWHHGIRHLDCVIISHADSDHFNGLPLLANQFRIDTVLASDRLMRSRNEKPMIDTLIHTLQEAAVQTSTVSAGESIELCEGVSIDVVSPPSEGFAGSDNANSIVLEICYQQQRLLLTGDIEKSGLQYLLNQRSEPYDVVLAPHHGSENSRPADFFGWSRPAVVISSSRRGKNITLHEHAPSGFNTRFLHTGYDGAIRVTLANQETIVDSWRSSPW